MGSANPLVIIGFDSLDYDFVEEHGFTELKQQVYGPVFNEPALMTGNAVSPTMWTSFMTGLEPQEHGVYGFDWDFPFSSWMYRVPTPGWGLEEVLKKVLLKVGRRKDFPGPDKISGKTFIDQLGSRVKTVNAPLYQFSFKAKGDRLAAMGMHRDDLTHEQLKENLITHSELVHEDVKDTLAQNRDWDVFFAYYYWLDGLQHNFYNDESFIESEYERAEKYLKDVKRWTPDDSTYLVVSDHGADGNGGHRNEYGFYSCSETGLVPEKVCITDFYDLIMGYTGLPTRRDEENIEERLKELGYR